MTGTEQKALYIADQCRKAGMTLAGVAGILINIECESAFKSTNLQDSYELSLGMNDAQYTSRVDNGSYMKKKGMGQAAPHGGQAGDLIIVFRVEPHKIFVRDKFDLKLDLYIPYKTAVLGGVVKVPTIDETLDLTIPEGTQSGAVFTMRGKGIRSLRGGVGNLIIRVIVEVPTRLSKDQKRELEKWGGTVELKQCEHMKKYSDNMEALYGKKPYSK